MFCTLKANNGAGEPYAFESTPPPFAKKRAGKGSKVACTNCRISKLRCSGDPGCCRRCFSKRVSCEYPPPPVWSSSSVNSHNQADRPRPTTTTSTTTSTSSTQHMIGMTETISSTGDPMHGFGILGLPTPATGDPTTLVDEMEIAHGHFPPDPEALRRSRQHQHQRQQQQHHHHIPTATAQDTYPFDPDLTTDMGDLVFGSPISFAPPKTPTNTSSSSITATASTSPSWPCSCLQQVMTVNEAIEIISWSQREACRDVYDVLQQQKAALVRCEEFTGCEECTAQPAYIMMLLSMYRKLSQTLRTVMEAPKEVDDYDYDQEQRKRRKDDSREEGGVVMNVTRRNLSSSGVSTKSQRGDGYGISIRERRLDGDDESLVLDSLVKVRVKMLRRIVSRASTMVSQHNWPVHKGVCRELQLVLDSVSVEYKE